MRRALAVRRCIAKIWLAIEFVTMCRNHALALQGKTAAPHSSSDGAYDETAFELRFHRTGNLTFVFYQFLLDLSSRACFGRFEEALDLSDKGEAVVHAVSGFPQVADHYFYRGLAAAVVLGGTAGRDPHKTPSQDAAAQSGALAGFCRQQPAQLWPHEALVKAEAARASGDVTTALKHYDRAIELAEAEGYTHLVGLANERAAVCCLANEHHRMAGWYLACARTAYDKFGATAKVAWLDREYATLLRLLSAWRTKPSRQAAIMLRAIRVRLSTSRLPCRPRTSWPVVRIPTACSRT